MRRPGLRGVIARWMVAAAAGVPLAAQALCTSDGVARPRAVLERFVNADCPTCWIERDTPDAPAGTLALDWVAPGKLGDDAPLAAVAVDEAAQRLAFLRRPAPDRTLAVTTARKGAPPAVRLAQGAAFNDYVGASIELPLAGREGWHAWLLLVEALPAGTEGSPVARNLVRGVFTPQDWAAAAGKPRRLAELRSMQIRAGAQPDRLRLVALVHDRDGRLRGASRTDCRE